MVSSNELITITVIDDGDWLQLNCGKTRKQGFRRIQRLLTMRDVSASATMPNRTREIFMCISTSLACVAVINQMVTASGSGELIATIIGQSSGVYMQQMCHVAQDEGIDAWVWGTICTAGGEIGHCEKRSQMIEEHDDECMSFRVDLPLARRARGTCWVLGVAEESDSLKQVECGAHDKCDKDDDAGGYETAALVD